MSLDYNKKNISLARNLRKNATNQEKHLWYDYLANYKPRFQRQKAIDSFIADFYCHEAKLIIELDGSQHYTESGFKKDKRRTEILGGYDLKILRFTNAEIDREFSWVCECIDFAVEASLRERDALRKQPCEVVFSQSGSQACLRAEQKVARQSRDGGRLRLLRLNTKFYVTHSPSVTS